LSVEQLQEVARYQITVPVSEIGNAEVWFNEHGIKVDHRRFLGYAGSYIRGSRRKLSQAERREIVASEKPVGAIAEKYQVAPSTIYRIKKGVPGSAPEPV
jgi:hypothetical protein